MSRLRIGIDLSTGPADGTWAGLVREAVALAPDIDFHLFMPPPGDGTGPVEGVGLPHVRSAPLVPLLAWPRGWQWRLLQRRLALDLVHLPCLPAWGSGTEWAGSLPQARMTPWTIRRGGQARLLCVPSQWMQDRLVERHGFDPARLVVTPPTVDAVRFHPGAAGQPLVRALGLEPGAYVCCVAPRDPAKLPLTLLEAYARMPAPRPTLVLIGRRDDPLHRRTLDAAVQRLGLAGDVRCLDQVSDTQLPALLRHARLFVQPSRVVHRGSAVLEAMASGVAVVASNAPVLLERVGRAGLTVNPHDTHELAAAMLCLLADPRRRQVLVQRGLERVAGHHARAIAPVLVAGWRRAAAGPRHAATLPAWA